jgi:hypothetical protein
VSLLRGHVRGAFMTKTAFTAVIWGRAEVASIEGEAIFNKCELMNFEIVLKRSTTFIFPSFEALKSSWKSL